MNQKKHEHDEMHKFDERQVQKRDKIGRQMFTISSWLILLIAGLSVRPELQWFAPIRWLTESANMAIVIGVLILVFWLIDIICLAKAGAWVPFRKDKVAYIVACVGCGLGGFLLSMLIPGTIYPALIVLLVLLLIGLVKIVNNKNRKTEIKEESEEKD